MESRTIQNTVSIYDGIKPKPEAILNYQQVLEIIQKDELKKKIKKIRAELNKNKQTALKILLPSVTWGGVFSHRKTDKLTKPSGFVVIDIDGLTPGELTRCKEIIRNDKYCFFFFISPGGEGIKAAYRSNYIKDDDTHKQVFSSVKKYLQKQGIAAKKIDSAGKDIARLCFLSHDPDLWINSEPCMWPQEKLKTNPPQQVSTPSETTNEVVKEQFQWFSVSGELIPEKLPCFNEIVSGTPKGQRSELIMRILNRLVWAHLNDNQIFELFEKYPIGDKYREKKSGRRAWLRPQIRKARRGTVDRATAQKNNYDPPKLSEWDIVSAAYDADDGTARLFLKLYSDSFRYDRAADEYFIWHKHFWRSDVLGESMQAITNISLAVDAQEKKIIPNENDKIQKDIIKAVKNLSKRLKSLRGKQNALILAGTGKGSIGIGGDEWDQNKNLLAFKNGVLELDSMMFRAGRREDMIKSFIPHLFEGLDTVSSLWEDFLNSIFDDDLELIDFIQRLFGYALSGNVRHHILPILWGHGRNGKGTLVEALAYCLGESLTQKISAEVLLDNGHGRNRGAHDSDTMSLMGKRICWGSETNRTKRLDTARVKELVGGDTLTARWPHAKRPVSFRPNHTLFLLTNNKPIVPADDIALWERLILIPFEKQFLKNDSSTDPLLLEKLKIETAGIIAWVLRGLVKYQEEGLFPLPEKIQGAVNEYQKEADKIGEFLEECCLVGPYKQEKAKTLYGTYKQWAENRNERPFTQTAFGSALKTKNFEKIRKGDGVVYFGLECREEV